MAELLAAARLFAIVPAAGSGERLRSGTPKALVPCAGKPILEHTLTTLVAAAPFRAIVITCTPGQTEKFSQAVSGIKHAQIRFIDGGSTRKLSVALALKFIGANCKVSESDIVLVHDAARALVSKEIINSALELAKVSGAVTCAVPVVDSIKRVSGDAVVESLDRSTLRSVQTPQVFRYDILKRAHEAPGFQECTDDAQLVEQFCQVKIAPGSYQNFKITTPIDLLLAEKLLDPNCHYSL